MNNFLKSFLLILSLVVTSTLNAQDEKNKSSIIEEIGQQKYYIHLVQPGEDLEQVAELYGVTVKEIYESTPGLFEGDKVQANHILRIPLKDNELKERKITDTVAHSFEKSIRTKLPGERVSRKQKPDEKGIQTEVNTDRFEIHTIKPNETLYSISRKYNVDVQDISNANPGLAISDLDVGQKLKIPVYLSMPDEENVPDNNVYKGTPFSYYTVKPKETVFRISKNFGISQNELIQMNPEIRAEGLKAGAKIRIPHNTSEDKVSEIDGKMAQTRGKDSVKTVRRYKVKFLERLPGISKREDVPLEEIYRLNPGIRQKGVSWGDVIELPRKALVIEQMGEESDVNYITHKVSKNETLYSISKLYDIPQEDIIALNPGSGRVIKKNQILKIPVKVPETDQKIEEDKIDKPEGEGFIPIEEMEALCEQRDASGKVFEVALMIPFFLESYAPLNTALLAGEKPNLRQHSFIQFYEGAMLALDTLKKQGMNVELFVYDVGKTREDALNKMDRELEDVDLIIGPIYRDAFNEVKGFADRHGIKIINPLSTRNSIIDNAKGVFKVQAPVEAEIDEMADFIRKSYRDTTHIFIVRDNQYQNADLLKYVRKEFEKNGLGKTEEQKIFEVVYYSDSLNPVLDSTKWGNKNIVVGLSDKEVFTIEFVRHMNEMRDSIPDVTLFGLSDWRGFNLEYAHLENLNVHIFDDSFIDYSDKNVIHFIQKFRNWYYTEPLPGHFAFEGYDVTYYFLSAMLKYGVDFEDCLKFHQPDLLQYQFYFEDNGSGSYMNQKVIPLQYKNYQIKKADIPDAGNHYPRIAF